MPAISFRGNQNSSFIPFIYQVPPRCPDTAGRRKKGWYSWGYNTLIEINKATKAPDSPKVSAPSTVNFLLLLFFLRQWLVWNSQWAAFATWVLGLMPDDQLLFNSAMNLSLLGRLPEDQPPPLKSPVSSIEPVLPLLSSHPWSSWGSKLVIIKGP